MRVRRSLLDDHEIIAAKRRFIKDLIRLNVRSRKDQYKVDENVYESTKLSYFKLQQAFKLRSNTSEIAQAEVDLPSSSTGVTRSSETSEFAQASAGLPNSSAETICLDGAQPSPEMDVFVKNLRVAEINNDVLSFSEDTCIGGDVNLLYLAGKLFVRECYVLLSDFMMLLSYRAKKFCVGGATGMGKSFFSYYMLHKLMGMKKTIVWKPADSADIVVCMTPTATQFARTVDAFEAQLNDPSTWYIVDASPPKEFPAMTLLFTSIDQQMARPFEQLGALTFCVPVWGREEVKKAHAAGVARAQDGDPELEWCEVERLLRKWAGVPRFIFQFAHNQEKQAALEKSIDDHYIPNILSCISEIPNPYRDLLIAVLSGTPLD